MARGRRPRSFGRSRLVRLISAASAGAKPWSPQQLGEGLRLWLDADDPATISLQPSTNTVQTWLDKSPYLRNVSNGGLAQYNPSSTPWRSSKRAVQMGYGDSFSFVSTLPSRPFVFFVVLRHDYSQAVLGSDELRVFLKSSSSVVPVAIRSSSSTTLFQVDGVLNPVNLTANANGSGTAIGSTSGAMFAALSTDSKPNGVLVRLGTIVPANAIDTIGNSAGSGLNGVLCEIVAIEQGSETAETRARIEGYLAWKWGMASELEGLHPYRYDGSLFGYSDQLPPMLDFYLESNSQFVPIAQNLH